MKRNRAAIILAERAADYGRLSLSLARMGLQGKRDSTLSQGTEKDQKLEARRKKTDDQSGRIPHSVS
jgi:hypothetical protein